MTFLELDKWITEALGNKDLEKIIKYIKTLDSDADIKKEIKKKFPKLSPEDLELVITLV